MDKVKFRSSGKWKRKRAEILKRDHKQCKICGNTTGLQCHHIVSIDVNDKLKLENPNIITLCQKCHLDVHNGVYSQVYLTNLIQK